MQGDPQRADPHPRTQRGSDARMGEREEEDTVRRYRITDPERGLTIAEWGSDSSAMLQEMGIRKLIAIENMERVEETARRRTMHPSFDGSSVRRYIGRMGDVTALYETWQEGSEVGRRGEEK